MLELDLGAGRRPCQYGNRREFLQIGTLALGGLSLPQLLAARSSAATGPPISKDTSVVLLFLTGGPSQIETFDPKPEAPAGNRSVTGAVSTSLPGVQFGGTFPGLAALAHRLAVVRSFTHGESNHTKAVEQVVRGGNPINKAGMGAMASRLRGASHPASGMPTHVYLSAGEVDRQFNKERLRLLDAGGAGELGGGYGPFQVTAGDEPARRLRLRIPRARLDDRLALNRALDRLNRRLDADPTVAGMDHFSQQALQLIAGNTRAAFDLSREDPRIVEQYDTSRFQTGITKHRRSTLGTQLLLARRLCEAGCGFVTIHNPGWDMHGGNTQLNMPLGMEELGRPVDQAVSTFLRDIGERGLAARILLIITGEFGRTPHVKDNGGRDHWPQLSTLAFAGGGLRMGQVIGRSNAKAEEPAGDPVTLDQLFGTVMHALFHTRLLQQQADLSPELRSLLQRGRPIEHLSIES